MASAQPEGDQVSAKKTLGDAVRERRDIQGWSQAQLAVKIPCATSMVGFVERGERRASRAFVSGCEKALGLHGELFTLWDQLDQPAPRWFRNWPKIEAQAHVIRTWEPLLVPGLLQIPAYAEAVLWGEPSATEKGVQDALHMRLSRQKIFDRAEPPAYLAVIDESVLHRPIGGPKVMCEQLEHLLKMMTRPRVTIQVVPLDSGATTGMQGGLAVAELSGESPWAYVETATTGQITESADEVRAASLIYDTIRAWALPQHVSADVIRRMLVKHEQQL